MIDVSNSIEIKVPQAKVFAFALNQQNTPKWQELVTSVEAPAGPVTTGYRVVNVREFMGQQMKTSFEMVEVVPNSQFTLKSFGGQVSVQVTFSFEPAGSGTKLTIHMQADVGGFFKVAEGMVAAQMLAQIKENEQNLKALLEKESFG